MTAADPLTAPRGQVHPEILAARPDYPDWRDPKGCGQLACEECNPKDSVTDAGWDESGACRRVKTIEQNGYPKTNDDEGLTYFVKGGRYAQPFGAFMKAADRAYAERMAGHLNGSNHGVYNGDLIAAYHKGDRDNLYVTAARCDGGRLTKEYPTAANGALTTDFLRALLDEIRSEGILWVELAGATQEKAKWSTSEGIQWSEQECPQGEGSDWTFRLYAHTGILCPWF